MRQNIYFCFTRASQPIHDPSTIAHLDAAMHMIIEYIQNTTARILKSDTCKQDRTMQLEGFTNSNWKNVSPNTQRFTGGYVYQLARGLIMWSSTRQFTISRSMPLLRMNTVHSHITLRKDCISSAL